MGVVTVEPPPSRIEPFPEAPSGHRQSIVALVVVLASLVLIAGALVVGRV